MVGLTEIAKRGGKVARADEYSIDAFDARDLLKVLKSARRLDLQQKTDLSIGRPVVSFDPAIAGRARLAREAAKAIRGVANRQDCAAGFLLRLHIGNEQRLCADIEQPFDDHGVVPGGSDDGVRRSPAHRLKLGEHHRQFVRRMLGVEQNPVESGVGEDFGDDGAREAVPQPELQFAGLERLLEGIVEFVHLRKPENRVDVSYTAGRGRAARHAGRRAKGHNAFVLK